MTAQNKPDLCLVCNQANLEPLLVYYSKHLPKFFHRIAICRDCGHIQLYPLWTEAQLGRINNAFFGTSYMVGDAQNTANNRKKLQKLDERLVAHLQPGWDILDVGAGEAWAMDYFQERGCHYSALEYVPRLAESIRQRGGRVIGQTIFDDYKAYSGSFDLIIFRHIIEHLLDPKDALLRLKKMLKPGGLIYLALPNAGDISLNVGFKNLNKKGFRTSFIRPIHVSYFCEANVHALASRAGLAPLVSNAEGEIFCLLQAALPHTAGFENHYHSQKMIFSAAAHQTFWTDWYRAAQNIPITLARRALNRMKPDAHVR